LPTRSSRCASTCTTPMCPISRSRSASFDTSKAPSTTTCFFAAPLRRTSSSTLMLTGSVVPTLAGPLQATRCFWVTTSSPSPRSISTSSLIRALRRSTASWTMVWQRRVGFVSYLWSCTAPCHGPFWSTVTTLASSTSPPTPSSAKHVKIDLHFVRERVAIGDVRVLHVPTTSQFTDIFTKRLPSSVFSKF
jgi:hypothetical protein